MDEKELLKQTSILYIEDDNIVRVKIAKFLRRRCNEVYEAENGKQGLELYEKHRPDLVITDIEMPIMDGTDLIKRIFEIDNRQAIIITTAFEDEAHTSKRVCKNIIKPIISEKLVEAIIECINKKV